MKTYRWHRIADDAGALKFSESGIATVEVAGKKLCIGKTKKGLAGFVRVCPHAGADLGEGYVDVSGNIVCPMHGYKYSLQNGINRSGEGYFLKIFPLEQRKEGLFIGLEQK